MSNLTETTLKNLEWDKVLEDVSCFVNFKETKENILKTLPIYGIKNKEKILENINLTQEAFTLFTCGFDDSKLLDMDFSQLELFLKSETLNTYQLVQVLKLFLNIDFLKKYFEENKYFENPKFTRLNEIVENMYFNKNIYYQIKQIIDVNEKVQDNASVEIKRIREEKKQIEKEIKEILINFTKNPKHLQEPIITIRNNRYVLPVKAGSVSYVKGYVQDISKNMQTYYIEPNSVIKLNNKIYNLELEEQKEIQNILNKMAVSLFKILDNIMSSFSTLISLDEIFAKAKYSIKNDLTYPEISDVIDIKKGYHLSLKKTNGNIVKNDFKIFDGYNTLIITGPNTGGKTVCLKTIGLIHVMALSGLFIPAGEGSCVKIVENIFADIGDMQSIEYNLSTFSSHMKNIIEIIDNVYKDCLVIFDELGSGTDPMQGQELAIEILKYLNKKNVLTIATSHYDKVKYFGIQNNNVKNASVEFDVRNLKPTYVLNIGVPGKSYAFEISKKLGLNQSIIQNAIDNLEESNSFSHSKDIEDILVNLNNLNAKVKEQEKQLEEKQNQLEAKEKELNLKILKINEKSEKETESQKIKANKYLQNIKEEINEYLKELDEKDLSKMNVRQLNSFRNVVNKKIKENNEVKANVIDVENSKDALKKEIDINKLKVGQDVFVISLKQHGTIYSINLKKKVVRVEVGIMKVDCKVKDILLEDGKGRKDEKSQSNYTNSTVSFNSSNIRKNVKTSINLIGYNVEPAIEELQKYIDNALICDLKSITIIHGKGSGKLREGIHKFLKTHPNIESYELAPYSNGGAGATVCILR